MLVMIVTSSRLQKTPHPNPLPQGAREKISHVEAEPKHRMAGKLEMFNFPDTVFSRFTKPSRGISEAKVEHQSTETLSFRCWSERCRLMRGAVNNQNSKVAFTLAEVLITLGIIGVVAALTLPTLISNYRERELITRTKRVYSNIYNATIMAQKDNDSIGDNSVLFNAADGYGKVTESFAKYFSGAKVCKSKAECPNYYYDIKFATTMYDETGSSRDWNSGAFKIILNDGAFVTISSMLPGCESHRNDTYYDENGQPTSVPVNQYFCAVLIFDVNGTTLPNRFGQDVFEIYIFKDKVASSTWSPTGGNTLNSILSGKEKLSPNK